MRNRGVLRRSAAVAILASAALATAVGGVQTAAAQTGLTITTPFPSVSVQPGASVNFDLRVSAEEAATVALAVEGVPEGWTASLSGGGNEVHSAYVSADAPAEISLTIDVPDSAEGSATLTVVGSASGEEARLALNLAIASAAGGNVSLESDYPSLRGSVDQEFQYNLTLSNNTPQQLTFNLAASGPPGWEVAVQPTGETRAASVTVDARGTQRVEVRTTPPPQTATDSYPILVEATAGQFTASAELIVEVTGSVAMTLTTPDQRLNTTANAGVTRDFEVVVFNDGTSPLTNIQLSGTGPSEWEIVFEPAVLEQIEPGGQGQATARITPSGNAVAGDYAVSFMASTQDASQSENLEIRVSVETSPIWGIVGLLLIAATLGGMFWVFRRYGRR